ncbi:hypothetical protein JCM10212_006757 [Sporobolomyces blumeae]
MLLSVAKTLVASALVGSAVAAPAPAAPVELVKRSNEKISPKVMIVTMFAPERAVWMEPLELTHNVSFAGASPLFPYVACNARRTVCHATTGEAEINAATTMMALTLAPQFNLTESYFLLNGIAGVNPYMGTLGSAGWARFVVQSGLAYELDARQMPANWSTGYWALGTKAPGQLPNVTDLYGTEVFELNTNLLDRVLNITSNVKLNDTEGAAAYRSKFNFAPANEAPAVFQDSALVPSDAYFAGTLLAESWGNYTELMTKGQGKYALTAQEDNASLEALMRADKAGLVDFSRVMLLRTASDFDRAPERDDDAYTAFFAEQDGFGIATQNLVLAGRPVVEDILTNWDSLYKKGIAPQSGGNGSFYGDDFGTIRTGGAQARRARRSLIHA